ncbi:unnamed protein product [Heterobilharzia americana]|nr:unnamed protein product [Heterobilharzia americana]
MSLTCNIRNLADQVKNKLVGERRRSSSSHDSDNSTEITDKHRSRITIQPIQQQKQLDKQHRMSTTTTMTTTTTTSQQHKIRGQSSSPNSSPIIDPSDRSIVFGPKTVDDHKRSQKQHQPQLVKSMCQCQVKCSIASQAGSSPPSSNNRNNIQSTSHSSCFHNMQKSRNTSTSKTYKQSTSSSIPSHVIKEHTWNCSEDETDNNTVSESSLKNHICNQTHKCHQHHQSKQHLHVPNNEQSRHDLNHSECQRESRIASTSHVHSHSCDQHSGIDVNSNAKNNTATTPIMATNKSSGNSQIISDSLQVSGISLNQTTHHPFMNNHIQQQYGSTFFIPVIPDLSIPENETRSGSLGSAYPTHCIPYHFGHSRYDLFHGHNRHHHQNQHHHHRDNHGNNNIILNNMKSVHTEKYNNPRLTMSYSELLNSMVPQNRHQQQFNLCNHNNEDNFQGLDHLTKSQVINSNSSNNISIGSLNTDQQLTDDNSTEDRSRNPRVLLNNSEMNDFNDPSQSYSHSIQPISQYNSILSSDDKNTTSVELNPPVLPTRTSSLIMHNKKCHLLNKTINTNLSINTALQSCITAGSSSATDATVCCMQQSMIDYPSNYDVTSTQFIMNNLFQSQQLNLPENTHSRSRSVLSSKRNKINNLRNYENTSESITINTSTETICNNEPLTTVYSQQSPSLSHHELLPSHNSEAVSMNEENERSLTVASNGSSKEKASTSSNESPLICSKSFISDCIPTSPSCGALEQFIPTNHASRLLGRMSDKLRDGRLADVILIAGIKSTSGNLSLSSSSPSPYTKCLNLTSDHIHTSATKTDLSSVTGESIVRIPAHRVILAAASDYFAAMFGNELKEASEQEIWIHDVEPHSLKTLINYIYTGNLDLREETIGDLLAAACFLQITEASQACERFLTKRLDATNCLSMSRLSEQYGCELLRKRSTKFVLEHFSDVAQQSDFLNLSFKELVALVSSDRLRVSNEATVFAACLRWTRNARSQDYRPENEGNESLLASLLKYVRLTQLPPRLLIDALEKETLFQEDLLAIRLVISALRVHFSSDSFYSQIHKTQTRTNLDCCLKYNTATATANNTANTTTTATNSNICSLNNSILDTTTSSLSSPSSLSSSADDQLANEPKSIKTLTQQQTEENNSQSCSYHRYHHHHRDQPYQSPQFSTRETEHQIINSHESYMLITKPRPSTIGRLWALGGKTMTTTRALQEILEYDPYWNTWRTIGQLPGQRQQCGCTILVDGRLLVVGGRDELKTLSTVECINIEEMSQINEFNAEYQKKLSNKSPLETSSRPRALRNRSRQNSADRNEIRTNTNNRDLCIESNGNTITGSAANAVSTSTTAVYRSEQQIQHNPLNSTATNNKETQNKEEYGSWKIVSAMATHRHGLGVAVLEGVVYAVGGHDGWSYLNTVERWNGKAKAWSPVTPMAVQRSTVGVAVLEGLLYAVGGRDGSACLRTVERFNPHTQHWCFIAPMLHRRGGVGVGAVGGRLYAVGGHNAPPNQPHALRTASVEMYEPRTDMWTETYTERVDVYDPEENKWTEAAPLPSGRAGIAVAASGPGVTDANSSIKLSYHKVDPLI